MQTFMPYPDYVTTARVLDRQRLGKQRVEAWQILNTLVGDSGWRYHPAVNMWRGHEEALAQYGIAMCREWINRGYRDTMLPRFLGFRRQGTSAVPTWVGLPDLHVSHRSNLIRKLPDHYGPLWPEVPNDLPYVWPGKD